MESGVVVTVLIFLGGLVFQVGRLSHRVESIEEWRREAALDIKAIRSIADRIDAVLNREDAR